MTAVVIAAGVYCGAARLGFAIAFMHGTVSAVWPPTGVALALVLLGLAALLSTMVSATIATAALIASDTIGTSQLWATWHVWWLGDVTGDVVVAPLLLVLATTVPRRVGFWREAEFVGFALTLAALAAVAHELTLGIADLVLPVLIWAAMRFGQRGAVLANAVLAGAGATGRCASGPPSVT